ncbi:MAG: phenylacetate--CoA ligase family protein [Betaproteobacteria bacterium]|nr:phenylacetate--CoA ligase family protein [Betaproteobacteria bacterium]
MSNGPNRMNTHVAVPRNALANHCWPAVPDAAGARMLALQYQLNQSQWWSAGQLREEQFRQLSVLLLHARETVPFYRQRLAGLDLSRGLDAASFAAVPLLTRQDVQTSFDALTSTRVPAAHGKVADGETSGSTGRPVRFRITELGGLFWQVFTLRDHLWHRRDLSGKLASIRGRVQPGTAAGWGPATEGAFRSGPLSMYNTNLPLGEQADWLMRENPAYLISIASNIRALARYCGEHGLRPSALREVRSYGEALHPDIRAICRQAWDVPVVDMYSCAEGGYLALQCPQHEHYHVQSESVLLEVLDREGLPCAPGAVGKVVITPLHNFAMPLLRYELGDYAEVGPACACGRGLPVITQIMGKTRHMLQLPDGGPRFPRFGEAKFHTIAPVRQFQVVQKSLAAIEVNLVVARALTPDEEQKLREHVLAHLKHPFSVSFVYLDDIPRAPSGKYEDFRCEIAPPA